MQALEFYKTVTADRANLLQRLVSTLERRNVPFCVIGGQAVNAYVDPLVSLDLDIVIAFDRYDDAREMLAQDFDVRDFEHSLNVGLEGSDLRVQVQKDVRYHDFVDRASVRDVLGTLLPVADIRDVLRGKVWAAQDDARRPSKRRKDLLDIQRIIEAYPDLSAEVPGDILERLA